MNLKFTLFFILLASCLNAQWTEVASLPSSAPGRHHAVTFELDGFGYLVTGGDADNYFRDFYKYDPQMDEWEKLPDFPGPARAFAYGVAHNGKAYMGFGYDGTFAYSDLWEYDPSTGDWTQLASCECEARLHPAFIANNGKLFVGLGNGQSGNTNDWWEYDIASNEWNEKPSFPAQRRHHPYHFSIGKYVYSAFGHGNNGIFNDLYRYDPQIEEWTKMANLPAKGRVAGTQFSYNGKGYALSGQGDDHFYLDTGEFWEYDPVTDTWASLPAHPGPGKWAPGVFVIDGVVYMVSGENINFANTRDMMKFDLKGFTSSIKDEIIDQVNIFPNPASDAIKIDFDKHIDRVQVFNNLGQVVIDHSINNASINIQSLAKGAYHLIVHTGAGLYNGSFVKE